MVPLAPGILLLLAIGQVPTGPASPEDPDRRTPKVWTRVGDLGRIPKRLNDAFPLSDQRDVGGWERLAPMSDEFDGDELDLDKWTLGMSWWLGRQPAFFSPSNVKVAGGELQLTMRKEEVPRKHREQGYRDYTSAAIHTKARSSYGYYEVRARPMNSAGSSAFWFQQDETPGWSTEIDVFEIAGKPREFERKYHMFVHVWKTPKKDGHWSAGKIWEAPWRLADDFHTYGLAWDKGEVIYYVDGVDVQRVENTHWHQPLYLIFDSETMPDWFGMPADHDLPSTFRIDYVRAWKRRQE